jgi:hypothetical protein
MIEVQAPTVANRVLADEPSDARIIVPMAVVVQPRFVVVVLALESDGVGQADVLGEFRALFSGFAPCVVLRAPGGVAVLVGEYLRRAEVVALVPGEDVDWQRPGLCVQSGSFFRQLLTCPSGRTDTTSTHQSTGKPVSSELGLGIGPFRPSTPSSKATNIKVPHPLFCRYFYFS